MRGGSRGIVVDLPSSDGSAVGSARDSAVGRGPRARQLLAVSIAEFPTEIIGGQPTAITTGSDGNLWFTLPGVNAIGSINPANHAVQMFTPGTFNVQPQSITNGPDGNLWFTEGKAIGEFNPTTHAFTETPIPSGSQALVITSGSDGNLWFTEFPSAGANNLGEINPTTHAISEFVAPYATSGIPTGITSGPDGNLWFTGFQNTIGTFNPMTHAGAEFSVPVHVSSPTVGLVSDGLTGITTGPDGNLWFTETMANRVGMINPTTHAIADFFLPTPNSYPSSIMSSPDGNLVFTEAGRLNFYLGGGFVTTPLGVSAIGEINPATHAITTVPTPSVNTNALGITVGPDGNLWFTEEQADQIGRGVIHGSDGPQITSVQRFGYHHRRTTLVLTFDEPLDPTTATSLGNYRILGPSYRTIRIASAAYDPVTRTVTLSPARRLNVHRNYLLTVVGAASTGVTDIYGDLLDGARTGQPGSDFVTTISRKTLVLRRKTAAADRTRHHAAISLQHFDTTK